MHYVTDDEAKINRGNRIGDPIASVDFCSVPSCYPSVHFVSLWGAILAPQGFSDLSLLCHKGTPVIWLGHSTFSTTADIYAHLDFSAQEQSAATMGAMFQRKEVSAE